MFYRNRWLHLFLTFGFLFAPLSYAQEIRPLTLEADGSKIRWVDANKTGIVVPQGSSDTLICDPALLSIAAANGLGSGANCISLRNFSTSPTNYVATTSATFANFLSSFQSDASKTACDVVPDPWSEWDGTPPVASSNWLDPSLCGVQEYTETRICTEPQYSCSDTCPGPDSTFSEDRTASVDNGDANVWHPVGDNESSVGASCYVPDTAIYNEVNECGQQRARTISCTLMPAIPAISVPASDLDGSYTVSWAAVDGAATYRLIGEGSGIIYAGSATSVARSMPTGVYSYAVSACTQGDVCTEYSGTRSVTVDITPSVPLISVPSTDTDGLFTISWSSVSGASRYQLSSGGVVIYDGAGTSTSVNRTNGIYSFKVRSVNALDTASGWSATKSITVDIPPPIPATPVLTVPAGDSNFNFRVSWTSVANATSYELVQSGEGVGWHFVHQGAATSKLFTTVGTGDYQYKVRAKNSSGSSAYSSPQSIDVNIKPAVPSLTVPSTDTDGTFTISWSNVSGATRYQLFSGGVGVYDGAGTSTTVTRTNGTYSFQVRALNSKNNPSNWSATKSITVDIPPPIPATPVLSVPSSSSSGTYTVSWSAVSPVTRYELVGESLGTIYSGTSRSAIRTKPNGTYGYKIRACNGSGTANCSPYSAIKAITVDIPPPIPATPVLTVPSTSSTGNYTVEWSRPAHATRYVLQGESAGVLYSGGLHWLARSKVSGTYGYKVKACADETSDYCSPYTSIKSITVDIPPPIPSTPVLTVPTDDSNSYFRVSWTSVANATSYELVQSGEGVGWHFVHQGAATSKLFTTVGTGDYQYKVRAKNSSGSSAYSSPQSIDVNIKPAVPSLTVPSTDTDGTFTISWSNVSGATRYQLFSGGVGVYDGAGTSTTVTRTNGTYSFQVRALNSKNNPSNWSATKSITVNIPPTTPPTPALTLPTLDADGIYYVSWSAVSPVTRYELVGESSGTIYSGTSRSLRRVKPNGTYGYKIRACNGSGSGNCSAYSSIKAITVDIPIPTPAPPVVSVPATSSGSHTVSWTSPAHAVRFIVRESGTQIYDGSSLSKFMSGRPNGSYTYSARSCNADNSCSSWSSGATTVVTVAPTIPPTPALTLPTLDADGIYYVSWSAVSPVTRYELVGESSGTIYSGTSRSLRRVKPNGTYGYKIRACNGSGSGNCSAYSSIKAITVDIPIPTPAPPVVSVPATSSGSHTVSWTSPAHAVRFIVRESGTQIYDGSSLSKFMSGRPNGSYTYSARSCNADNSCSSWSSGATTVVTVAPTIPSTPLLTVPGSSSTGNYTVQWSRPANATRYVLQGESAGVLYSGGLHWLARSKDPGVYGYKVKACADNSSTYCSGYSGIKSITVLCTSDVWTPDNGLTGPQTQATCYEPDTIMYYETNECGISRQTELPCTGCNPNEWSCAATGGSLASCAATCPSGSTFATVNACGQTGTAACTGPPLSLPGQCGPYNNRAFVSYNSYFIGSGPGNTGEPGRDHNENHCEAGNKVFTRNGPSSCGRNFCQYKTYWVCSGWPDSSECGVNIRSGGRYGP